MIDAALILTAETQVDAGHAEVIEERRVVGPGAERADAQVGAGARFVALRRRRVQVGQASGLHPFPHRQLGLGIFDLTRHAVDELFERVRALHTQNAAAIAIGIDVDYALALELLAVRLGPLGGAEQPGLLAIPRAVDDGALRFPALLQQRTHRAHFLHHGNEARDRILSAVHPRVVMVAAYDPLIGELAAANA